VLKQALLEEWQKIEPRIDCREFRDQLAVDKALPRKVIQKAICKINEQLRGDGDIADAHSKEALDWWVSHIRDCCCHQGNGTQNNMFELVAQAWAEHQVRTLPPSTMLSFLSVLTPGLSEGPFCRAPNAGAGRLALFLGKNFVCIFSDC
jgi:hypothetical protein